MIQAGQMENSTALEAYLNVKHQIAVDGVESVCSTYRRIFGTDRFIFVVDRRFSEIRHDAKYPVYNLFCLD